MRSRNAPTDGIESRELTRNLALIEIAAYDAITYSKPLFFVFLSEQSENLGTTISLG